ncbi:hypothetical protein D3C81_1355870 [compost metagenome]
MRVFAVAQVHYFDEGGIHLRREFSTFRHGCVGRGHGRQVVADRRVVLRHAVERGDGQRKALRGGELAVVAVEFGQQRVVLVRAGGHGHAGEILGGAAQHCRAADIDVLNRIGQRAVGLGGDRLERIQVQHQQVDRRDAVLRHHRIIGTGAAQQAAMDHRVQGLDPAIHHFRETGDVGDILHRQAGVADGLGGTAGGQQLDIAGGQGTGQFDQTGLVGNRQQGPADGQQISRHGGRGAAEAGRYCSRVVT